MTIRQAEQILQPPLRFGDAKQIEAHNFWLSVLELKDHLLKCDDCTVELIDGTMEVNFCYVAPYEYEDDIVDEAVDLYTKVITKS